jgi:hypothetical protein
MGKHKRIKSKNIKEKLNPIPHNNRGHAAGRMVRTQIVIMKDKNDPTKVTKKTIFHMNLSPHEQQRIHVIKVAVEKNDENVMKTLNPRERKLYDHMLKEKQKREEGGTDGSDHGNNG